MCSNDGAKEGVSQNYSFLYICLLVHLEVLQRKENKSMENGKILVPTLRMNFSYDDNVGREKTERVSSFTAMFHCCILHATTSYILDT